MVAGERLPTRQLGAVVAEFSQLVVDAPVALRRCAGWAAVIGVFSFSTVGLFASGEGATAILWWQATVAAEFGALSSGGCGPRRGHLDPLGACSLVNSRVSRSDCRKAARIRTLTMR